MSRKSGESSILRRLAPRKTPRTALLALFAVLIGAVPAAFATTALLSEQPVLASSANEMTPAAGWAITNGSPAEWIAYAKSRPTNANAFDAYFGHLNTSTSPATVDSPTKLNRVGQGYLGGIDFSDTNDPKVVYQGIYRGESNISIYHVSSGTRTNPGVNTARWEWRPTMSGNWLLFNRDALSKPLQQVMLKNLSTGSVTRLTYTNRDSWTTFAGQVNGNSTVYWAVWTKCAARCNVFVENLDTKVVTRLAKPGTEYQYAPSVTSTGTVYLARGTRACGANVQFVRYSPAEITAGSTGTLIAALAAGRDTFSSFAREDPNSTVSVFYDRVRCSTNRWNVYKLTDGP